ncbi:MAG: DUF418 domain-containing protein, partial [Cryobacterium sp.]
RFARFGQILPRRTLPRIVGIDVARGLAIIGMFAAHAAPRAGDAELFVDGRSSILFATLAGISLGIMTGSARPTPPGNRADRLIGLVVRAAILFVLGVTLAALSSGVAIILDYYAIMFLMLVPVLFLRRWMLAALVVILLALAPLLGAGRGDVDDGLSPLAFFMDDYLLNGFYPVLIWLPFLIGGLICARSDLARPHTQRLMMLLGSFFAVAGYGAALVLPGVSAEAHSGSTAEVFGSGGFAIAVIGGLLWATAPERGRAGRVSRGIMAPVAAAGAMALTLYTLQILALAALVAARESGVDAGLLGTDYPGWPLLIGMVVASVVFASLWRVLLGKGPLERLLARAAAARPGTRWRKTTVTSA